MSTDGYSDETLMAFADGELDAAMSAEIERAITRDDALAARVAMFAETRSGARDALAPLLDEPVPAELAARIDTLVAGAKQDADETVVALEPPRPAATAQPPAPAQWRLPLAASIALIAGGAIGYVLGTSGEPAVDGLVSANLAQPGIIAALESVASGAESTLPGGDRFRAIASYADVDGTLCREFEVDHAPASTVVAVACRPDSAWTLQFTVARSGNADGYAPASSLEALEAYLNAVDAGEPMSPEDEAKALQALR